MEAYSSNLVDYHLIIDLIPIISKLFFLNKLSKSLKFSYAQAALLIGIGLQHKSIDAVSGELKLPVQQALALFNKMIKKVTKYFKNIYENEIETNRSINVIY